MSSRLPKIRSVHVYVMVRTVYFGWICIIAKWINVNFETLFHQTFSLILYIVLVVKNATICIRVHTWWYFHCVPSLDYCSLHICHFHANTLECHWILWKKEVTCYQSIFLCPSQRLEASRGVYFSSNSSSSNSVFYLPFLKIMKNQVSSLIKNYRRIFYKANEEAMAILLTLANSSSL